MHTVAHPKHLTTRQICRQMLTNWYTCLHTNSQRPACSFMPVRPSALYQDDGQVPEQTFDLSSQTHPRNLQPLWMGDRKRTKWKTVCESQPFRCLIIKYSLWHWCLRGSRSPSLSHSPRPATHPEKKVPHCFHRRSVTLPESLHDTNAGILTHR